MGAVSFKFEAFLLVLSEHSAPFLQGFSKHAPSQANIFRPLALITFEVVVERSNL